MPNRRRRRWTNTWNVSIAIESEGLQANISIKPTQLGLAIDEDLAMASIARLGERAAAVGTTVTIDMEDSRYTEATVRLFEQGKTATGNFGVALQAYLHRTPSDIERLAPRGGHIRLCKGAYVEPEAVALTSRKAVDAAFSQQLRALMALEGVTPAIATHDTAQLDLARELAEGREAPFEFQMLYGVRPELQRSWSPRATHYGYTCRSAHSGTRTSPDVSASAPPTSGSSPVPSSRGRDSFDFHHG